MIKTSFEMIKLSKPTKSFGTVMSRSPPTTLSTHPRTRLFCPFSEGTSFAEEAAPPLEKVLQNGTKLVAEQQKMGVAVCTEQTVAALHADDAVHQRSSGDGGAEAMVSSGNVGGGCGDARRRRAAEHGSRMAYIYGIIYSKL